MKRHSEKGMALVITLMMLAIVTFMAVVFLALSRRERGNVKLQEDQMTARYAADNALAHAQANIIARMNAGAETYLQSLGSNQTNLQHVAQAIGTIQRARFHYDLFASKNYLSPSGFTPNDASIQNVNYQDKNGNFLSRNSSDFYRNVANLQLDPRPPVYITDPNTGRTDFNYYLDLNRNGAYETNGTVIVSARNGQRYDPSGRPTSTAPFLAERFTGDPEWIGVLERPDLPHSETNRFTHRFAYLILPAGKSLDINFIHNQASYDHSNANLRTNLAYVRGFSTNRYSRNQGVGSWEMNLAGFLTDFHTNVWQPANVNYYEYSPRIASGLTFSDAGALLQYRLNYTRDNLLQANQALTNKASAIPPAGGLRWDLDMVDENGDGPVYQYDKWYNEPNPMFTGLLADNDEPFRYWHGMERMDRTKEYPDVQRYFGLGAESRADLNAFLARFNAAVTNNPSGPTANTYDKYAYYRLLTQMGSDSKPAVANKIHLNFINEPGTISTNLVSWITNSVVGMVPAYLPRPPIVTDNNGVVETRPNLLTNFFLIAANEMLRASLVTNVFLDDFGRWRTNYTVGGSYFADPGLNLSPGAVRQIANTPVRPDIAVNNIQIYHEPLQTVATLDHLTMTNAEYTAALHRVLQLAANIYDNMTNRSPARSTTNEPYLPTVFRPIYQDTATNIMIVGWEPAMKLEHDFALRTNNWTSPALWFTNTSRLAVTNYNFYGQPWVVGVKKGWPTFNEFSVETHIQVTRKLELNKLQAGTELLTNTPAGYGALSNRTGQIFMIGVSNTFGIEAWNSYAKAVGRPIQIRAGVWTQMGINKIFRQPNGQIQAIAPVYTTDQFFSAGDVLSPYVVPSWPGRTGEDIPLKESRPAAGTAVPSDFRVPIYEMFKALSDSEYDGAPAQVGRLIPEGAIFQPLSVTPELRLNITNRIRYVAVDAGEDAIIDFVSLDNLVTEIDLTEALRGSTNAANSAGGAGFNPGELWNSTPIDGKTKGGITVGMVKQLQISLGEIPVAQTDWKNYTAYQPVSQEITNFLQFLTGDSLKDNINNATRWQAPFSPTRKFYLHTKFQANDPLVHYTAADLRTPKFFIFGSTNISNSTTETNAQFATPLASIRNDSLGKVNVERHRQRSQTPFNSSAFQDTDVGNSDDWEFPIARIGHPTRQTAVYGPDEFHYRYPNIGTLGAIHRGTPWQSFYLKAEMAQNRPDTQSDISKWAEWSGSYGTHPTNDWKLIGLFTTALSESAARGLLSVNQSHVAAWSAVLSGVPVITNSVKDADYQMQGTLPPRRFGDPGNAYNDLLIQPGSTQLSNIVRGINIYRANRPLGVFAYLGEILGTPELTHRSPYLNRHQDQFRGGAFTDAAFEAIPRRILSLLKEDEPRMTIYCFGQTLKPAARSLVTDANFYNLCVNYQVTGEYATKAVIRVEGELKNPNNPLRTVVESFEALPPFEQ